MFNTKPTIIGLIIILLIVSLMVIYIARTTTKKSGNMPTPSVIDMITTVPKGVRLFFAHTGSIILTKEEPVIVTIALDSQKQSVTGFDVVLLYDETKVSFKQARSLNSQFTIYPSQVTNKVLITGIKTIESTGPTAFEKSALVEVEFTKPLVDHLSFKILYSPSDKKSSTVIDTASHNILQSGDAVIVHRGNTALLTKNKSLTLGEGITLQLKDLQIPDSLCRDCITSAQIIAEQAGKKELIEFSFGGFAGIMKDEAQVFGHSLKAKNIDKTGIELIYIK